MGIPNNSFPFAFVSSSDHVVVPLVAGSTHVVAPSFFDGHAAHVASLPFLDTHVVPPDIVMMLQLAVAGDVFAKVAFVAASMVLLVVSLMQRYMGKLMLLALTLMHCI